MERDRQLDSGSQSAGSRYPRLRSMLPKTLLYDNVSLSKQLSQVITNLSVEERKASYSWTQLQKRFIAQQAIKQEYRGMKLLPSFHSAYRYSSESVLPPAYCGERTDTWTSTKQRPSAPVCTVHEKLDRQNAFVDTERRSKRRGHPVKDGRFVRLYRLLSDVKLDPVTESHNQKISLNLILTK